MPDSSSRFPEALTFDDVLLTPGYSTVLPSQVSLRTRLAGDLKLGIPVLSAAMDTVTDARLAIALAREGGIGIIHRNMSGADQAKEVDKVKRSESGMIVDPITLPPTALLSEAEALMSRYHISGVPITEGGKLVGILTNRDVRFVQDLSRPVYEYMTKENLVTAHIGTTLEEAKALYILKSNPVQAFDDEMLVEDNEGVIPKEKMYKTFKEFCRKHKIEVKGKSTFSRQLQKYKDVVEERKKLEGGFPRCWVGVSFRFSSSIDERGYQNYQKNQDKQWSIATLSTNHHQQYHHFEPFMCI